MNENRNSHLGPRPLPLYLSYVANMKHESQAFNADDFIRGVQKYQKSTRTVSNIFLQQTEHIASHGKATLHYYAPDRQRHTSVLLIPSLINGAQIMDLCEQRSFARWLCSRGHGVYLLDWGDVLSDKTAQTKDQIILEKIPFFITESAKHSKGSIAALGYCMGGTLLAAAAQNVDPGLLSRLILMAAPFSFHSAGDLLSGLIRNMAEGIHLTLKRDGYLSASAIQALLAMADPMSTVHKFSAYAQKEGENPLFVAVEDWLADNRALPADIARMVVMDWYVDNKPLRGCWRIGAGVFDPSRLSCPVHIVASKKDRLVPYESAVALEGGLKNPTIQTVHSGHIGLIAGRRAVQTVWNPIQEMLQSKTQ